MEITQNIISHSNTSNKMLPQKKCFVEERSYSYIFSGQKYITFAIKSTPNGYFLMFAPKFSFRS